MSKSKPDAWMPMFVADYAADTSRLSLEQHGAYLLLIFDYWRNGPPPDDDAVIARILGVERREWFRLRPVISRFFVIEDGTWRHKRVEVELQKARGNKASGANGGASKWGSSDDPAERGRQLRSQRLSEARKKGTHTPEQWAWLVSHCGRCVRCGAEGERLVKDHIKPLYQGGSDGMENLQPLCRRCNASKGPEATDFRPAGWLDAFNVAFPAGITEGNKRLPNGQGIAWTSPSPSKKLSPEAKASSESAAAGGAPSDLQKLQTSPPKPDYRAIIEAIWSAQPVLGGKRRATRPDVAKAFAAAINRGGDPAEILAACQAYYRLPACTKDAGQFAMGAAVLIEADRWREYLPTVFEGAANSWAGPASIREAVVTEQDEAFARSYLDPAAWIDPQSEDVCGSIVARNGYAHGKLKALHCLRDMANLLQPEPKECAA